MAIASDGVVLAPDPLDDPVVVHPLEVLGDRREHRRQRVYSHRLFETRCSSYLVALGRRGRSRSGHARSGAHAPAAARIARAAAGTGARRAQISAVFSRCRAIWKSWPVQTSGLCGMVASAMRMEVSPGLKASNT